MENQTPRFPALLEKFQKTIISRWGKEGEKWLNDFPNLLQRCEERFSIEIGDAHPNCAANFIAGAKTKDGKDVVLKIGDHKGKRISCGILREKNCTFTRF